MLHAEGTSEQFGSWRERILGLRSDDPFHPMSETTRNRRLKLLEKQGAVVRLPGYRGIDFMVTSRNSSALWGANLIDSIPDEALESIAMQQSQVNDGIAGRVSRLIDPDGQSTRVGKFGWRGQTASLEDFVRGACVTEMGLQLQDLPQPVDPTRPPEKVAVAADGTQAGELPVDMSSADLERLVSFVRSIPPPAEQIPDDPDELAFAMLGRSHFDTVGCVRCHVRQIGEARGIYGDLLLHNMGQALEDPLASPGMITRAPAGGSGAAYYGAPREIFVQVQDPDAFRRWRTPPLWGVRDTAPYLHDGRAATLHDAIIAHGGEGAASAAAYTRLSRRNRNALVAYVNALGHPNAR